MITSLNSAGRRPSMTPPPQRVLIIGSGPIVIGQAKPLLRGRFVHHAAGADDLAQEGVTARLMVLAGRIADGLDTTITIEREAGDDALALWHPKSFEVGGNNSEVDVAPLVRLALNVGTIQNHRLNPNALLKEPDEVIDGLF